MRRVLYCLAFVSVLASVSCSQDLNESETRGGLSGVVADKTTGEPVPVVSVKIKETGTSTVTGTDGSFSFTDLEEGTYTVLLSKEGYKDNTSVVSVTEGKITESHLLIERIPAVLTIDREVLDFGDNYSNTTLSFSMVNKNYVDLDWEIVHNCRWITEINPDKSITKLGYGKTQTVVVVIDRDLLLPGNNETVIVVRTSDGASELMVKAEGQEKRLPALNIKSATEVKVTSAILNAEITDKGIPEYEKRGFVLGTSEMPTLGQDMVKVIPAEVNLEQNEFSVKVSNLELKQTYYARAYAINKDGVAHSTNQISFTTVANLPSVSILDVSDVKASSAILNAEITDAGTPVYTERGFVVGDSEMPTIETATKIIGPANDAQMAYSAKIENLVLGQTYYVRAYVINDVGTDYSVNQVGFSPVPTMPKVSIYGADNFVAADKRVTLHGSVDQDGDPKYNERGFVYAVGNPMPTIVDNYIKVDGSGTGTYDAIITDLVIGAEYYARAYARSDGGIAYSEGNAIRFVLSYTKPEVEMLSVSNLDSEKKTAVFMGQVTKAGDPHYSERGFVYSSSKDMPTMEDLIVRVNNQENDMYDVTATELSLGVTYSVRAYAINEGGISYSAPLNFTLPSESPSVLTLDSSGINRGDGSVTLNGKVEKVGVPAYTERGFVYSETNDHPTVTDGKLVVEGTGDGNFSLTTKFNRAGTTYVRAYVISELGPVYGETIRALGPEYVKIGSLYVQLVDRGLYTFANASSACSSSKVENLAWRLPTLAELQKLYANRSQIGGFGSGSYWSTTYTNETVWNGSTQAYYILNMSSGTTSTVQVYREPYNTMTYWVRCVR